MIESQKMRRVTYRLRSEKYTLDVRVASLGIDTANVQLDFNEFHARDDGTSIKTQAPDQVRQLLRRWCGNGMTPKGLPSDKLT